MTARNDTRDCVLTGFDNIDKRLARLRERDRYRRRRVVESPQGRELIVDGRRLLNFCSNDYLGLAADQRVSAACKAAVDRWGLGSGASHLVTGHTGAHHELEVALAEFTGRPRALLFSSGYMANVGVINALLSKPDRVYEDRLNHASLLDGGWISRAAFDWYAHVDMQSLDEVLSASNGNGRALIVSDGTFSMDGDRCPLDGMLPVARRHGAWIMIDDAHGFGVHGPGGRGLVDPALYTCTDVPVLIGTLGKAFGTFGAFVAGDDALIETLIQRSRNYIYTTALPSAIAEATLTSLQIVTDEQWRRDHLDTMIRKFRAGATDCGLELLPSSSPIQPIIVGDAGQAVSLSRALEERGVLITAIRPPTVPEGTSRLRLTITAAHTEADIDQLLQSLADVFQGVGRD